MKNIRKYSQKELLEGITSGDSKVIAFLYSEYFHTVRHLVIKNSGNKDDANDVFQEVLIIFFRKLKEPAFELTSSLHTYLYSIARYIWLKELENRRKFSSLEDTMESALIDTGEIIDIIERNDRLRLYREKFEQLSNDCKRVINMFLNNVPIREITRLMGYSSEQHTKNRRFRCKTSLIKKIRASEKYNELSYGKGKDDRDIPRW